MVIRKEELVLYALSLLESDDRPNIHYTRENLSYALDITDNTLNLYLTNLKRSGLVQRHKKKYFDDIRQTVALTEDGRNSVAGIGSRLYDEYLTPERHNIHTMVKISVVLERITDILEKIFFLSLFTQLRRFDLPLFLETVKTSKQENNVVNILSEIEQEEWVGEIPVVETFFRSCLYGMRTDSNNLKDFEYSQDPNTLLIIAEATTKQGRYSESRSIFNYLLSPKVHLSQNQWTIARINLAHLDFKEGKKEDSIKELERLMGIIDNKIFISYIKQMMGRIYSASGEQDRAIELFTEAINSFSAFGLPLLSAITYNNRGVAFFIRESYEEAESDWQKARKYAKEANSRYVEAAVFNNLADIELIRSDLEKSWKYNEMGFERFGEVHDLEGIAWCEFQRSLYYLHAKDSEKALVHFGRSESIAFPSPSPGERRMRREVFLDRGKRIGIDTDHLREHMMEEIKW